MYFSNCFYFHVKRDKAWSTIYLKANQYKGQDAFALNLMGSRKNVLYIKVDEIWY